MPLRIIFCALLAFLSYNNALAQLWDPMGVPVCECPWSSYAHKMTPDGEGGAYVAWLDGRGYPDTDNDIYLQRIDGDGTVVPGWPIDGLPVCVLPATQDLYQIVLDGHGGVLLVWFDFRNASHGTSGDIYAQRILSDGTIAPGWPINGAAATRDPRYQTAALIADDGSGGAYVLWMDDRNWATQAWDLYAQHLTATGEIAPGWPQDGLPICTEPGDQYTIPSGILADGSGGTIIAWGDVRDPGSRVDVYGLRILPDGSIAPGWQPNGVPISTGTGGPRVVLDHDGGFYVGSTTTPSTSPYLHYYIQRFTFDGVRAAGWPEGGVAVCTTGGDRYGLKMAEDGFGGALLTWYDYRPGYVGGEIFVSRYLPDGTLAPGWTPDGVMISDPAAGPEFTPEISPDGLGGAYVSWGRITSSGHPARLQHLAHDGQIAMGWPEFGVQVAPTGTQFDSKVAPDGSGGVIVAWDEERPAENREGIYAQRVPGDGPVPTLPTLMSAEATMEKVTLLWFASESPSRTTAYRRSESSPWQVLGYPVPDAAGHLRYEDRSVSPGARYAYRLGFQEGSGEQFTDETWVEIPSSHSFSLGGFQPNPAVGKLVVQFSLPSAERASLEIIDVRGRVRFKQDVAALGPGSHTLDLTSKANPGPGIYWIRLRQGEQALVKRGTVLR